MKIHFTRTGGVAGTKLSLEIDTEKLPLEEARRLQDLFGAAAIFSRRPITRLEHSRPDCFAYRLSVEDGARKSELEVDEPSLSAELEPLLNHLVERARRVKGKKR